MMPGLLRFWWPSTAKRAILGREASPGKVASGPVAHDVQRLFERQEARAGLIARWLDALALRPGQVLLDIGCGPGLGSLMAAERIGPEGRVYAVDPDPQALSFLLAKAEEWKASGRKLAAIFALQAPGEQLHLPEPVHAALITHMLHHAHDAAAVLRAAHASLRPEGRAVVAEFDPAAPGQIGPPVSERISAETLKEWLEAVGFEVERTVAEGEQEQYALLVRPKPSYTSWRFETLAIHAGQAPEPATGAVVVPIYQTSTFAQAAPGVHKGYEYARTANPTRRAVEEALAALEGGRWGLAFASGMAAISALGYTLRPGQRVLVPDDVYGGTWRFFSRVLGPWGVRVEPVDMTDLGAVEAALARGEPPALVMLESPTNPTLKVVDIRAVAELAHRHGVRVAVDNTFASPYLQRPLELGADLVVHSTTKYLGGHSDVVGGAAITSDPELAEALRFVQNAAGAVPGPFDCWLVLRGIKTLAVRMQRHCHNAARVADFLQAHPAVEAVYYPGLPHHPGHDVARRQMRHGFGGMVSFVVRGGEEAARRVVSRTRVFTLGESLGGVESLIEHPASMTHLSLAGTPLSVHPGLVRLSVGIEHIDDLLEDLRQALEA